MRYSDVSPDEMYEGDDRAGEWKETLEDCQGRDQSSRDPDVIAQESAFSSLRRRVIAGEKCCLPSTDQRLEVWSMHLNTPLRYILARIRSYAYWKQVDER